MSNVINAMQARVRTTEIKGVQYQIYMLPAGEGIPMANKLLKVAAPALAALTASQGSTEKLDFTEVAKSLINQMDNLDILAIIKRLIKDMAANGQGVDFDSYFMCNYGVLVELVIFALKENFSSFFEASVSLFNQE